MTTRKPLVNISGEMSELPVGEAAKASYLYALTGVGVGVDPTVLGTVSRLALNPNLTVDNAAVMQINTAADASKGLVVQRNSATQSAALLEFQDSTGSVLSYFGAAGNLVLPAPTTAIAGLNLPHGTAPASPVNGDLWTTTAGLYARINGSTVGPFSTGTALSVTTVSTSSVLTSAYTIVLQLVSGIVTSLWASPTANDNVTIKNSSDGDTTLSGNGKLIEGNSSITLLQGDSVTILYNGTQWLITAQADTTSTEELWVDPPASSSATGITGQFAFNGTYRYDCVGPDTWVRHAVEWSF